MAKWGEGDPRWIVEERADATNVNNWHWTEKNATQWSIDTIKKIFSQFSVCDDDFSCDCFDVTKCEGEAHVNNRKGKLIFFYEWVITANWSGRRIKGDNKTNFTGTIEIPNLSEEFTVDEFDVSVTCSSSTSDGDAVKKFMHTTGSTAIRQLLGTYLKKLREEYSQGVILPTNSQTEQNTKQPKIAPTSEQVKQSDPGRIIQQPKDLSVKELTLSEEFFCTPNDIYNVLTSKQLVQAFTRTEAVVDAVVDGNYSIFEGNITGRFTSLLPGSHIALNWRKRDWPDNHFSTVAIDMEAFEGGTRLKLTQIGVPAYDLENTRNGWRENFFNSINRTYGYGGRMF